MAFDNAIYQQWLQRMDGNNQQVEAGMNHRHLVDLLPVSVEKPTQHLVVSFGRLLQEASQANLIEIFLRSIFALVFLWKQLKS